MNYQPLYEYLVSKLDVFAEDSEMEQIRKICIQISLPDNPMEIEQYNNLWSDPKSDYDLGFQKGLEKGYEIAKEVAK